MDKNKDIEKRGIYLCFRKTGKKTHLCLHCSCVLCLSECSNICSKHVNRGQWTHHDGCWMYLCAKASAFCAGPGRASELGVVSQISSVPLMFSMGGVTGVRGDESSPPGDSYMWNKIVQLLLPQKTSNNYSVSCDFEERPNFYLESSTPNKSNLDIC